MPQFGSMLRAADDCAVCLISAARDLTHQVIHLISDNWRRKCGIGQKLTGNSTETTTEMSASQLKSLVKRIFTSPLQPHGFILATPRVCEREGAGLWQGIEFQSGRSYLAGRYTLNIYWRFNRALCRDGIYDACLRIGELYGETDDWFSLEPDGCEQHAQAVERLITVWALPYLSKYDNVAKILADSESGALNELRAFGPDEGWRLFNKGFCYAFVGDKQKARSYYQEVVDRDSKENLSWIVLRRSEALRELAKL